MLSTDVDRWYLNCLTEIALGKGYERGDKVSLVQQTYSHDLGANLPLLRIKPTPWRSAIKEFAWFCSDSYDYLELEAQGVTWWRPWIAHLLPPAYDGKLVLTEAQLPYKRLHTGTKRILSQLAAGNFDSTRLYCNLWPNESELAEALLPPCALAHQVTVTDKLNLTVYQRSADLLCGVPTNLAQYAWLASIYAKVARLPVGQLTFHYGDLHVYKQHLALPQFEDLLSAYGPQLDKLGKVKSFRLSDKARCMTIDSELAMPELTTLSSGYERLDFPAFPVVPVHALSRLEKSRRELELRS